MSKFFSKRRFHLSSPANLMPSFASGSNYNNNSSKNANSSSSPCSSSSSPIENGGFASPQSQKRLTRQRKLRHVTVDHFCMPEEEEEDGGGGGDRSKSLPGSPNSDSESRSPQRLPQQHWSLSAVPQPLPLPNNDEFRFPAEAYSRGEERSHRNGMNAEAGGTLISSKPSTYHRRRGYPQDINGEKVGYGIRLDVPPRSAPATTFTSPALSPKRFSTLDIFDSAFGVRQELHLSPPSRPSPVHSPPSQSPYLKVHLLNHKSPPERTDSNNNKVHPLPLPPGVSRPAVSSRRSLDKSEGQSTKGQWQKGKLLGRGTYGSVYEATNRETGSLCALKEVDVIPDDTKSLESIRQLEQEIKVLRNLEHPNIVQYLGSEVVSFFSASFILNPSNIVEDIFTTEIPSSMQVEDKFCIYLEHVHPGSISKYVRERCGAVTESVVRNFTRHILSGLAYLHSKKTVHRDIKGANLLVDSSGVVKLADFGLAKHLSPYVVDLSLKGTPHWMAPEVLQAAMRKDTDPEHTYTMDIWSLGCTVIEMVTGKPPWSEFSAVQAMFNVLNRSPPIPETLSSEGKDFLSRCLQRNPEKRSSAASLLEHPFVRNSFDHNLSLCKQEVCQRSNEILYTPRDSPAQHKDIPGSWVRHGRLQFHRETPKHQHAETTTDHLPATRHSPRSILEVVPSGSSPEPKFSSTHWGISQTPKRLPAENGRTYSLPSTPNRETYLL
ncbi:hypothetical protein OSB04_003545 [Centaurea solstitialis]|uniref:mitogen-activated protein kinase kinase kinase n=1 Tax=Centaurea solstitialis TaxID=347529 RepID=A0AA38TWV3_9ASTR|nr:hypothetical protein OSB04_003545 [Centaurea solstitialis]